MFAVGIRHFCIHVKPVLHAFGEVLFLVGLGIRILPQPFRSGVIQQFLKAIVDLRMNLQNTDQMDGMGELMDEDSSAWYLSI